LVAAPIFSWTLGGDFADSDPGVSPVLREVMIVCLQLPKTGETSFNRTLENSFGGRDIFGPMLQRDLPRAV
jgi:hypothetical protein